MIRGSLLGISCAAVAWTLSAAPASAQNSPTPAPAPTPTAQPQDDKGGLEDIVVTAERRSDSLQRVPVSVTALTDKEIERRGIVQTLDLIRAVPNLSGRHNVLLGGSNAYFLRGIGSTESLSTFDPAVGTYIDEVFVARQNANNIDFYDVERIEVLRGPQGTLFGRNTSGGAINIITKKPGEKFGASGLAGYGRFNEFHGRAAIDLPLSDAIRTRLSGYYVQDDGYMRSVVTNERYDGRKNYGVRLAVRILPTSNITWDIAGDYGRANAVNLGSKIDPARAAVNRSGGYDGPWLTGSPFRNNVFFRNCETGATPFDWVRNQCVSNRMESYSFVSNLGIKLSDTISLNAITGYRHLSQDFSIPLLDGISAVGTGGAPNTIGDIALANRGRHKQFSQELKLVGSIADDRLKFVTGLFYMTEDNTTRVQTASVSKTAGVTSVSNDNDFDNDVRAFAAYGSADLRIVDGLTFTAGLRYTHERKLLPRFLHTQSSGFTFNLASIAATGTPTSVTVDKVTPRFVLNYRFNDRIMAFVSATNGFKSGGWNGRGAVASAVNYFRPETVWSYEAGLRTEFLDRRVRANVTLFRAQYKDLQLPSQVAPGVFSIDNAGDLRAQGAEFELSAKPVRELTLYTNVGLLDAKYTRISAAAIANGVPATAVPQYTPESQIQVGFVYDQPIGSAGSIVASGDIQWVDKLWTIIQNPANSLTPAQNTANASIGWNSPGDRWGVSVGCTNCFNKKYWTLISNNVRYPASPMRWTIDLRFKFD